MKEKMKFAAIGLALLLAVETGFGIYKMSEYNQKISDITVSYQEAEAARTVAETELEKSKAMVNEQAEAIAEMQTQMEALQNEVDRLSQSVVLPVKTVYQNPQLPNGCEITSATTVLNYWGYDVSKVTMADTYLPRQYPYYAVDPNVAYMGNPHTGQGWYCFAGPIVTAVNSYFDAIGDTKMRAKDITGASVDELKEYIKNGYPIVFWGTVGFNSIRHSYKFKLPNGEYPYTGLHCLVVSGYDQNYMYINDPMGITSKVSISTFTSIYDGMGKRAVLIEQA